MTVNIHIPVLLKEVIDYLGPKANENFIDCTFGEGGHSLAILEKTKPNGKILGIDQDREAIRRFRLRTPNSKLQNRLILVNDNFANLKKIVEREKFHQVAGILADLGISTWHLKESGRGFTFLKDEALDMRLDKSGLTAREIINRWPEREIERILRENSQERFSGRIARAITQERRVKTIATTFQLSEIVRKAVGSGYERGRIHPATRTFLALRVAVNSEIENLRKFLAQALEVLRGSTGRPQGRLVVISFHSREDAIVKSFLREKQGLGQLRILTQKPRTPLPTEREDNLASRSAKLRAAVVFKENDHHTEDKPV